jgi:hypothetical protein
VAIRNYYRVSLLFCPADDKALDPGGGHADGLVIKKDPAYLRMTKFFGKLFLINLAAPLAMEGMLAFFMESVFLGLWLRAGHPGDLLVVPAHYTLLVMTWGALIFTPVVLACQGRSYWVFRKRLSRSSIGPVDAIPTAIPPAVPSASLAAGQP